MTNTVLLKRSNTANAVPLASNLTAGELALNYTDGNLFYKNSSGAVTLLASNQQLSVTGNITAKYFLGNANIQYTASTAPVTGNLIGAQWYNTSNDILYEYQTDGTSNFWVDISSPVIGGTAPISNTSIINGTSSVAIPIPNSNVGITVGNVSNIAQFATTGVYVIGVISASGTVTGTTITGSTLSSTGNVNTVGIVGTGAFSTTGNITGGNILGGANVNATTHTGTTVSVTGNITGGNILGGANVNATTHTGTTVSVSANITGGNLLTGGLISATGNITGGNILGGANVNATTHTGTTVLVSANITGGNLLTGGLVSATANITGGNLLTAGLISATGNIQTANNIVYANTAGTAKAYQFFNSATTSIDTVFL